VRPEGGNTSTVPVPMGWLQALGFSHTSLLADSVSPWASCRGLLAVWP
jgi:hypothetical protein